MSTEKTLPANPLSARLPSRPVLLSGLVLLAVLLVSYWSPISGVVARWFEPDYLYGFLVPPFAALLLWRRRDLLAGAAPRGSWWGLALIALAAGMRFTSAYYNFALLDPMSLVPCLLGLVLFLGGWRILRWSWPSIVFLAFAVPLPGFVAGLFSHPLQRIGTKCSTFVIQTIGIPAVDRGNVITLAETELGVVEACSGLRMMMLFVTVCVGAAFWIRRSWWEKALLVLCAAPIAILANVFRITLTSLLYQFTSPEFASAVFHDFAGALMMPFAVLILWMILALYDRLWIEEQAVSIAALRTPARSPAPATNGNGKKRNHNKRKRNNR